MRQYSLFFTWHRGRFWNPEKRSITFGPSKEWMLGFQLKPSLPIAMECLCLLRQKSGLEFKLDGSLFTESQGFIIFRGRMDSNVFFLPINYLTLLNNNDSFVNISINVTETEASDKKTNVNEKEVQTDSDFNILNVKGKPLATTDTNALTSLSRDMQTMYEEKHHSDFTLMCGSETFHVHKCVLSVRSPVFASMLQHPMNETVENRMIIPDINAVVLDQLVSFMYTGRINELSFSMARDLYSACDKYAVLQLKDKCSGFLISSLCTSTAVEVLILGDMHNDIMLKNAAISFISNNFEDLNTTEEWLTLVRERPSLGVEVLSSAMTQLKSKLQERK